jgi:hypothetical protein
MGKIVKKVKKNVDNVIVNNINNNTDNNNVNDDIIDMSINEMALNKSKKKTRILTFDVGIVNLAYCIADFYEETMTFEIIDWNIINVVDSRLKCCNIGRGNKKCESIATRMLKIDDNTKLYYCTVHSSKAKLNVKPIDIECKPVDIINTQKCRMCDKYGKVQFNIFEGQYCAVHGKKICNDNDYYCATPKCNNYVDYGVYVKDDSINGNDGNSVFKIGWCCEHYEESIKEYITKRMKKFSQDADDVPLDVIGLSMYNELNKIPHIIDVDVILIENQPSIIAGTMKSVSVILFSYFLMNCIHNKIANKVPPSKLGFCAAANKISIGGDKIVNAVKNAPNKDIEYDLTKEIGKMYCYELIRDNDKYLEWYNYHKKKDDMADAFLHFFVSKIGKRMPDKYKEKIYGIEDQVLKYIEDKLSKTKTRKINNVKQSIDNDITHSSKMSECNKEDENINENNNNNNNNEKKKVNYYRRNRFFKKKTVS